MKDGGRGMEGKRDANEELRRDSAEFVYLPPLSRTKLQNYASALDNFEKAWDSMPHKRGALVLICGRDARN